MEAMNVECLAQVIHHEARGESRDGKIAVGQVVINRVKDKKRRFGKDVCSVVLQKGQFSGFRFSSARRIGREFYELAEGVLKGQFRALVGDALYFRRGGGGLVIGNHGFR